MLASQWPTWIRRTVGFIFLILAIIVLVGLMLLPFLGLPDGS